MSARRNFNWCCWFISRSPCWNVPLRCGPLKAGATGFGALAVWLGVSLLIPVRVWEPALVFAIAMPLIVATVRLDRWRADRIAKATAGDENSTRPRFQFGLKDILLATLLVGLSTASLMTVVRNASRIAALDLCIFVITFTTMSVAGYYTVFSKRRLMAGLASVAAIPIGWELFRWVSDESREIWAPLASFSVNTSGIPLLEIAFALMAFMVTVILCLALFKRHQSTPQASWAGILLRGLSLLLLTPIGLFLINVYWSMVEPRPLPPKYENPENRFREIMALAEEHENLNPTTADAMYAKLLPLLKGNNSVEINFGTERSADELTRLMKRAPTVRSLTRSLTAKANEARDQQQMEAAAEYAESSVRLAAMMGRGGYFIDFLVGVATESVGVGCLADMRDQISPARAREVIEMLNSVETHREPLAVIMERDKSLNDGIWISRLHSVIENLRGEYPEWSTRLMETTLQRKEAESRLLQVELAIRLYRAENQQLPSRLVELVPKYLPKVPLDPYSDQELTYRADKDTYTLYSVGPDRTDNGGKFGTWKEVFFGRDGFDFDIDTQSRADSGTNEVAPDDDGTPLDS